MQTDRDPQELAGTGSNVDGEQLFRQWATRRLMLYQDLGGQVQTTVTDLLQLASEFTIRMEEETNQLIEQYRQQQADTEANVQTLQREMEDMRRAMAEERQAHFDRLQQEYRQQEDELGRMRQQHDETLAQQRAELERQRREQEEELTRQRDQEREALAQQRQQQEDALSQLRQRALNAMEEQMRMAQTERDQMLRDAYAERNRVFAQTRQLSTRLAQLQQALQGLAGVSSYQAEDQWQDEPAPAQRATEAAPSFLQEQGSTMEAPSFFGSTEPEAEPEPEPLGFAFTDEAETGSDAAYSGDAYSGTLTENVEAGGDEDLTSELGENGYMEYGGDSLDPDTEPAEDSYTSVVVVEEFAAIPAEELLSLFETDESTQEEGGTAEDLFAPTFEEDTASQDDLGTVEEYGGSVLDEEASETNEPSFADELFAPTFDQEEAEPASTYEALDEFSIEEALAAPEPLFASDEDEADTALMDLGLEEAEATPEAAEETAENPRRLVIEGVTRFTLASDLIDRLEQSSSIQDVDLLLYEQTTLLLYVQHDNNVSLEALLQQELGDVLEVVQTKPDVMHLRVRA